MGFGGGGGGGGLIHADVLCKVCLKHLVGKKESNVSTLVFSPESLGK